MPALDEIESIEDIKDIKENLDPSFFQKFLDGLPEFFFNLGLRILLAVVFFLIGRKLIKIIVAIVNKSLNKAGSEKGVITFIDSFLRISLYALLFLIIASELGVEAASILAIFGSATLAVGLALQGSLSNLAGGVVILLMKPFKVGDYIKEDSHGNEGRVAEITIFYTKLTTVDNKEVMIPNGALANTSIVNTTWLPTRKIDFSVGISYDSDLLRAKEVLKEVAKNIPGILDREDPVVFVRSLDDSSVTLGCRFFVDTSEYWNSMWELNEKVKLTFDAEGIEITYNKLDVNLRSVPGVKELPGTADEKKGD
ncbi:MAG: mechanosensitive ion channel family protein [Lachnospiraceae bacterium]|nr:mechanosensitive ion channel family protein [Lachnospiraceae bacterium]